MIASHEFAVNAVNVPLTKTLPNGTAIFRSWPRETLRIDLPRYLRTVKATAGATTVSTNHVLMSRPLHLVQNSRLEFNLINQLQASGLSVHFHGFVMNNAIEYDGVVGVTQCAISPTDNFLYNFTVDETPGTYWYHTHSGSVGVDSYNAIKGPIIVHPPSALENPAISHLFNDKHADDNGDFEELLSYGNERILFFSDGSIVTDSHQQLIAAGGLNPPVSKNDDGFTVGTARYDFGHCNGKLRETVSVEPGKTYKLRLINGGQHYAFRVSIGSIPMQVVAADSEPVHPYEVDEVILHTAERFDVLVTIPSEYVHGDRFWIRADTLESTVQGYQNGVRAILNIVTKGSAFENLPTIPDPPEGIMVKNPIQAVLQRSTMNCYSPYESTKAFNRGSCLPITELKREVNSSLSPLESWTEAEIHTVDFEFSPPPLFAHFVRIDEGLWLQHQNPSKPMLAPEFDLDTHAHPHHAMLNVPPFSSVIIVWRNKSLMDHPMHLHGFKMEILDVRLPVRSRDCTLSECKLNSEFSSEVITMLDATIKKGASVMKDTFIMPAGGAVATRIQTYEPALWFAHCHIDTHSKDGMAFVLNVGDYHKSNVTRFPDDSPSCGTPFLETIKKNPACKCYIDNDAVLNRGLTHDHRCSRDYVCHHKLSQAANLDSYSRNGIRIASEYSTPNWVVTTIVIALISAATVILSFIIPRRRVLIPTIISRPIDTPHKDSLKNKLFARIYEDWKGYQPGCTNALRVFEVTGLALLTGVIFYDVGNDSSSTGLSEKYSLLFFSITLWTFTRMYPAIANFNSWFKALKQEEDQSARNVFIWCFSRSIVVLGNEGWWPFIHCAVTYSMAGMFNKVSSIIAIGVCLSLNTVCYVSIGGALGLIFDFIPLAFCTSTIVSQTSLVAAGFYTEMMPGLSWIRYGSPVFWCFRGITKTALRWNDTFTCMKGQSEVGPNYCYLEFSPGIDALKRRGINVATFNDSSSDNIYLEIMMLVVLFVLLQTCILVTCYFSQKRILK